MSVIPDTSLPCRKAARARAFLPLSLHRYFTCAVVAALALLLPGRQAAADLTGSALAPAATVDLTATGAADWVHWGLSSVSSVNRKAGVIPAIGSYTSLTAAPGRFQAPAGARVTYNWSDGTPSASGSTTAGLYFTGTGNGFALEVPAGTAPRTLQLYVGGWVARGELRATLSDASAAPYVTVIDNPNGVIDRLVTITYSAAMAGQTLNVRYALLDDYGRGNITLSAATLSSQAPLPNLPPLASNDGFGGNEDAILTGNVLANDSDPDNAPSPLRVQGHTMPAHGSVSVNADGRFSYTPHANYHGADGFEYTVTDGASTASATVTLAVLPVNDAPVASNGVLATLQGVAANGVLTAIDVDGDNMTFSVVTNGAKGSVIITNPGAGEYVYTPAPGAIGADSFTFQANDGVAISNTATIDVTITAANGVLNGNLAVSPVAVDLSASGTADWVHWGYSSASSINRKAGVSPRIGNYAALGAAPGRFLVTPGSRTTYNWSDGTPTPSGSTASGLFFTGVGNGVTLNVPADTTPRTLQLYVGGWVAKGEFRATLSDASAAPYVTVIDTPNGVTDRVITIAYRAGSAGQTLTVRYAMLEDYGQGNITLSAATLSVQGNSPPVAGADNVTLRANSTNQYLDVLANDRDPDPADRLSIIVVNAPDQGGTVNIVDGGTRIAYTPPARFTGKETFSYVIADAAGESAMALVSVVVVPQIVPNIIVILADDLGYQDVGVFGASDIYTPNLDRMAQEGVRFTDFYSHVTCGPSRAALMTGSYAPRANLSCTEATNATTGLNSNEITVAEQLRGRGYVTKIIGKWHLGDHSQFLPTRHGFDQFYGLPYSHDMWPFHPLTCPSANEDPRLVAARQRAAITGCDGCGTSYCVPIGQFPDLPLYSNQNIVAVNPDPSSLTGRFTQEAIAFIEQNRTRPFFLYLPYSAPHVPLSASAQFRGTSSRGMYGDVVQELDWGVGQVLASLKRFGVDQNTLVVFTSDNGPWLEYGIDAGSAGPLRGGKKTVWEGGVRVPTIMRWPGYIPAGTVTSRVAHLVDLLPTLSGLGGAALPTDRVLDGANIWPLMIGQSGVNSPHEFLMYYLDDTSLKFGDQSRNLRGIRWGKWKLMVTMNNTDVVASALYNLDTDIGETTNVIGAHPDLSAFMRSVAQYNNDELRANSRPLGVLNKSVPELFGSTHVPAPGTVTLSTASALDWAHWGYTSTARYNHKAGVSRPISDVVAVGKTKITVKGSTDVTRGAFSWSGGTPVTTAADTKGYIQTSGKAGTGFEVRLPADAESRTLKIYLGVLRAKGRIEARLSDNSAPAVVTYIDNPSGADNRIAMFNYRAATNGAQLIIRYVIDNNYSSVNGSEGRISLSAMTVTRNP